jgi:hypothetical protein
MNSGVNLGATFCLEKCKFQNIKKRDAPVGKQGIPQTEKEIAN